MNNLFETSDYHLCVTLCVLGYILVSIDRTNPNRNIFQFKNEQGLQNDVEAFFKGNLRLDPRLVLLQAKLVKNRLREGY
jgi:hypothetical protein